MARRDEEGKIEKDAQTNLDPIDLFRHFSENLRDS